MTVNYRFIEHTADVGIEVYSPTLKGLYETAGHALFMLMVPEVSPPGIRHAIEAEGADRESLLVNFMNDLLAAFELKGLLFRKIEVKKLTGRRLEADTRCERFDPDCRLMDTVVKAVTFHGLEIKKEGARWRGVVYLDL